MRHAVVHHLQRGLTLHPLRRWRRTACEEVGQNAHRREFRGGRDGGPGPTRHGAQIHLMSATQGGAAPSVSNAWGPVMSATATSPALSAWLDALGLGSYATAFDRHGVSVDVLPHLTLEDLRSIGVEAVGHRRKLMVAIEALSRDPATLPTIGEVGGPERRQLTVMFCDLVGSTALSARLDPEDMGGVLWRFHAAVAEAAARYGGHVAKLMERRRPRLFRLSPGPRGRPRARRPRRSRPGRRRALHRRDARGCPRGADRHRDRRRRGRRTHGRGRSARARRRRRHAQPRGPPAGAGGAECRRGGRRHARAARRRFRGSRPRLSRPEGLGGTRAGLGGRARSRPCEPVRGRARARTHPLRRPRAGNRPPGGPLAGGCRGRRAGRAAVGRSRHRQVAHRRDLPRRPRRHPTRPVGLPVLAAPRRRSLPPGAGPAATLGAARPRRGPRVRPRQDRVAGAGLPRRGARHRRAAARPPAVGPGGRPLSHARPVARRSQGAAGLQLGGAGPGARPRPARLRPARGRALDRREFARPVRTAGPGPRRRAGVARRDGAARGHAALGGTSACDAARAEPSGAPAGDGDGRRGERRTRPAARRRRRHRGQDGRRCRSSSRS